jgi:hypothetical protein
LGSILNENHFARDQAANTIPMALYDLSSHVIFRRKPVHTIIINSCQKSLLFFSSKIFLTFFKVLSGLGIDERKINQIQYIKHSMNLLSSRNNEKKKKKLKINFKDTKIGGCRERNNNNKLSILQSRHTHNPCLTQNKKKLFGNTHAHTHSSSIINNSKSILT